MKVLREMMGFTKIPNWFLDFHNDIYPAPFRVLCCIYRVTQGFQRPAYKIKISTLINMSGVKAISRCFKILKEKGFIEYEYVSGKSNVITIKPMKSVKGLQNKALTSVNRTDKLNEPHQYTQSKGSRGAKERFIEKLKKDLFIEFKQKYPEDKFDDDTVFEVWQYLSDKDQTLIVGVMEFQNNQWNDPNFDRKYIPKASNYLLKRKFMDDSVREPFESEIRREKDKIKRLEYYQKADHNAATDEEKRKILNQFKD